MYINLNEYLDKQELIIKGVIHIGAHKGEELGLYRSLKIKKILLYEANNYLIKNLKIKKFLYKYLFNTQIDIVNKAVSDNIGFLDLNVTSNSQSSSILKLKEHSKLYPNIKEIKKIKIESTTLNKEFEEKFNINDFNMLNMDIQGAELLVLKGASSILDKIDLIYTEINFIEMYENCALADELDQYLIGYGFHRALTKTPESDFWGDAIYVRK